MTRDSQEPRSTQSDARRKFIVRCFFFVLVVAMTLDAMPWEKLPTDRPKVVVANAMGATGLWQSQWSMFAPNPSVNYLWLTAEVKTRDGDVVENWTSPYWPVVGSIEKFLSFRSINYFNRLNFLRNRAAAPDFADYLARQSQAKQAAAGIDDGDLSVRMFSNSLNMISPSDGALPPPEELTWVTQSTEIVAAD